MYAAPQHVPLNDHAPKSESESQVWAWAKKHPLWQRDISVLQLTDFYTFFFVFVFLSFLKATRVRLTITNFARQQR